MNGLIFNTQRFSVHDGDGIRTTVFFKGCNLRCFWCHNPESLEKCSQIGFYNNKCIGCGKCIEVCPNKCFETVDSKSLYHSKNCKKCGKCVENCYTGALCMWGSEKSLEELCTIVMKDKAFYDESGGGVTCSGGEPLLQWEFVEELLKLCKSQGINTAIETALNVEFSYIERILPFCDCLYIDIKCKDAALHRKGTGIKNDRIIENLLKLNDYPNKKRIRIPLVPGFNDVDEEFIKMGEFIKTLSDVQYTEIMPFHKAGNNKYNSMGMEYDAENISPPDKLKVNHFYDLLKAVGVKTII